MEKNETRRVGTFTLGVVLVICGIWMMATMFYPRLDLAWVLKGSPLILISLGVETLLSARSSGKVKYDWLGMILCFILVCAALCLYAIAYVMVWHPEWIGYW